MKTWTPEIWERDAAAKNNAKWTIEKIIDRNLGPDKLECVEQYSLQGELIEKYHDIGTAEIFTGTWKRDILRCEGKYDLQMDLFG